MERKSSTSALIQKTLKTIREVIASGIKNVYLVGSLASGESTVLNSTCVSDVDMIIDVKFVTFIKIQMLRSRKILSDRLSLALNCHVSLTITSLKLARYFGLIRPNTLYLYEMTPLLLDEKTTKNNSCRPYQLPDRSDSLNLAFSSIADYLFLQSGLLGDISDEEKLYVIAKRCLTLFNSFLIYKGLHSRSYLERMKLATKYYPNLGTILLAEDISTLQILTDFKLSGDLRVLSKLPVSQGQSVINFLNDYFKIFGSRVFVYLVSDYTKSNQAFKVQNDGDFYNLLNKYKSNIRKSLVNCHFYALSQILLFLKDRNDEKLKVALYSISHERLKVGDFIRLLIGRAFLKNVFKKENLRKEYVEAIKQLWDKFMN